MIFIAPDMHLEGALRDGHPVLSKDWQLALTSMTDSIISSLKFGDNVLILPGDVYDYSKVQGDGVDLLREAISDLKSSGVQVYSIAGNHDIQRQGGTPLAVAVGATALTLEPQTIAGLRISGIDYCPREQMLPKLAELSTKGDIELLVIHCAMQEFLGFEGAYDLSSDELPENVKSCVAGDIHIQKQVMLPNGGWLLSPGVLHAKDVGQDYEKGIWMVDNCLKTLPQLLPIWTRPIVHVTLDKTNIDSWLADNACVGDKTPETPVLDVVATNDILQLLRQEALPGGRLSGYVYLERKLNKPAEQTDEVQQNADINEDRLSLAAALPYEVDRAKEPELFDFLHSLLTDSNPKQTIEELTARMLA